MAGAGNNAVRVAALDHHAGIVHILVIEELFCLFPGHTLGFTQLDQRIDVLFGLGIGLRIYDDSAGDVQAFAVLGDFVRAADDDQIGNAFLKGGFRCLEGAAVHRFGKNDGLFVLLCALFDAVQE